jgi:hypothetical protein
MQLPSYPRRFAHLAALWAFGVSQPVFSMLKGNPEFLVVRGSSRVDVVTFAILVAFVPPLAVVAVEWLVSLASRTVGRVVHVIAVWCAGCLVGLQLVRMLDIENGAALLAAMIPATLGAFSYLRWSAFRSFLSIAFALPVLGSLAFVATVPLATDDAPTANVRVAHSTPVVMVVMDEFPLSSLLRPDGSIDAKRYPNFARLAGSATWYSRATTVHEFTTQAVPAVVTGQLPREGELPTLRDHPRNLFTLLGGRYALRVIEPVTRLCPARYCPDAHISVPFLDRARGLLYDSGVGYLYRVLPASLREGLPPIGDRWGGFDQAGDAGTRQRLLGALDVNDVNLAIERTNHQPRAEFARFLRAMRPTAGNRSLFFLHLLLPHAPYRLLPSGREYGNAENIDGIRDDSFNEWATAPLFVDQAMQRLLLQVGYVDRLIGDLTRRLKATGLYDRALIVVTADHGASFHAGGFRRTVSRDNLADIGAVPLFVKYPGQRAGIEDDRDAKIVDILPTVADVLGIRMPWDVDGRSLRDEPVKGRRVTVWPRTGGVVTASSDDVHDGVLATARRQGALFGVGVEPSESVGPHHELIGRSIDDLDVGPAAGGARVRLDGETLFANVRTESEFVPARVAGEIAGGSLAPGSALAIAVNGTIAATTRSFALDGRDRFAVLVPERAFREGRNAVVVLSIASQAGSVRLSRLGGTTEARDYVLSADGSALLAPDGAHVPVAEGRIDGSVESSTSEGMTVRIKGWAADLDDRHLVDRVLVFADRRLVFSSATTVYRWDIDKVRGKTPAARVGFVAELPLSEVRGKRVRAFAVEGNVASELAWPSGGSRVVAAAGAR